MTTETANELSAEQVVGYLTDNPTFFLKRENLLADLYLPHSSGDAVSLFERQVKILRERNIDMRKRLAEMMEHGQRNDDLFDKTRTLVLHMLDSKSLNDLSSRLAEYCEKEFNVSKVQFTLFANPSLFNSMQCRVVAMNDVERSMPSLVSSPECVSGAFRPEELRFLFAGPEENLTSAIVLPIRIDQKNIAILALGSEDPHYFKAGMDTLFLNFIGDVISHLLPRFYK